MCRTAQGGGAEREQLLGVLSRSNTSLDIFDSGLNIAARNALDALGKTKPRSIKGRLGL